MNSNPCPQAMTFPFKSVPGDQVELENRLFQKNPGLSFQLGRDAFRVDLRPETTPMPFNDGQSVYVRMDDRTGFELSLENAFLLHLAPELMPYEELAILPEEIQAVVLEVSLEKLLDRIDRHSGGRSSLQEPERVPENMVLDRSLLAVLTRQNDGYRSVARIRTDAIGATWLAARLARVPHKIDHGLGDLPLAGRVEVGRVVLSCGEMRDLSPFDIVLTDGAFNRDLPDVFIRFSSRCVLAATVVQPRKILVQDIHPNEMESLGMKREEMEKPGQSGPPTGDIPVDLVFEIGTIRIPLAELRRLQPGYTFQPDLPIDPFKPVTIKANGVKVGRGEIIRIENRLGIRILDFDNDIVQE